MERSQPEGQKPWACACCAMEAAELAQTLRDAGCTEEAAATLLADAQDDRRLLELLARHRAELLDEVHRSEKKIDCLDYLVYQLEKRRAGES